MKGKPFFGGIPTEPDINKLLEHIGVPEPGVIPHSRIEAVIGVGHLTRRYSTVVRKWRKKLLREHNIDTEAVPGEGIRVLTGAGRVDACIKDMRTAIRGVGCVQVRASLVPEEQLDPVSRYKHDHLTIAAAKASASVFGAGRTLTNVLKAPPQLPRAKPD